MPKADNVDKLLSPEDAKAVLQKNLANIVKKSAAGKTLSAKELAIIQGEVVEDDPPEKGPRFVDSYEELGAIFGPHRASFPRFLRDHKDAPIAKANGRHSVAAWKKFFQRHPDCLEKVHVPAEPGSRKEQIEDETLRKLKIANDQKAGLLVVKADVAGQIRTVAETQKGILREKLEREYPALISNLMAEQRAELRKRGKELVDDLSKRMQRLVDGWEC